MSQIFAIFAIFFAIRENLYARNICQSRLQYPQQIWHLDILFTVTLYYGTSASLAAGSPTDTFLVPPSPFSPMSHHPRFGRRTEMFCRSRKGTPARARGSYGRLTAKPRAQIGRYAIDWEQLNCHAGTHLLQHTRFYPSSLLHTRFSLSSSLW